MLSDAEFNITLTRTQIPTLPSGYLSRKHLFPLLDNDPSGTTLVIAPGGYGKSSLVAEWAQNKSAEVIWLTVASGDTINEMSAMLIAATRRIIPKFAPWFEIEQPIRPTEVVRRWGNELLKTGKNYIYVLDSLRSDEETDIEIANKLIEQFPSNLHFVVIRREEIQNIYATCASRGPIKVLTIEDLRFSEMEIESYLANAGLELTDENRSIFTASAGWPAAISLLRENIEKNGNTIDIENLMTSTVEPLRALTMIVIKNLESEILDACKRLSVLEIFSLEEAKFILGKDFSLDLISSIANKGEIFTLSRDPQGGYVFSPLVRQILIEILRREPELKDELHRNLIGYFEKKGKPSSAIDHAFQAGDESKISELFPDAARIKQAQGKGGDLIRWSVFAGDDSLDGELKKLTVKIAGHLAELDFGNAKFEIEKLRMRSVNSPLREFFEQFALGASCYSMLSLGNFTELEESISKLEIGVAELFLGVDDQINLLRMLAVKRYIFNDATGVEEIFNLSQELGKRTSLYTSHIFLSAIQAMHLHQRGEYRQAHEIATLALNQHLQQGFVGNHGPLDVMFISARCLLEFARPHEALAILEQIKTLSHQWKQWHWYVTADKHIIEFQTFSNQLTESISRIKESREFVETIDSPHQLQQLLDISEMAIRRRLNDFDRLEVLVNRTPVTRDTQHYRSMVDQFRGRKSLVEMARKLPESTPRDLIWKSLTDAELNLDSEKVALAAMHRAMQAGAAVGARETFLRQSDEIGNLVIRVANDFPTVYNEELATAMAVRMKERGNAMTEGHQALTKRELEILRQLSTGRTLTVIAGELHISQNTMKTHLKNLYRKLSATDRNDALEKAKTLFLL